MIIRPAAFEGNRTVWKLDSESQEPPTFFNDLWIDSFVRDRPSSIEALWLGLALAFIDSTRLVLPNPIPIHVHENLEAAVGLPMSPTTADATTIRDAGEFSAFMIRDVIDAALSYMVKNEPNYRIGVHCDQGRTDDVSTSLRFISNIGLLRRSRQPLDYVGELAVVLLQSPSFALKRVAAFLCREELSATPKERLIAVARDCGIELWLPFSEIGVRELCGILLKFGFSPILCFRGLSRRYWAFPEIVGSIYRELETQLTQLSYDGPDIRIARHLAETLIDEEEASVQSFWQIDQEFYC